MSRQQTNSITHLVKIVANEEIDRRINELKQEAINTQPRIGVLTENFRKDLQASLDNAGGPWSDAENCQLREELAVALALIAKTHSRSGGAISAKVRQILSGR